MAGQDLISFRGRTLFPGDLLTLGTAVNVAGQYNYTPDSKQVITFAILLAFLVLVSLLPKEEKRETHIRSWRWSPQKRRYRHTL